MRRALAVAAAVAVVISGAVVARAADLDAQRADAVAEARQLADRAADAEARTQHLLGLIGRAEEETRVRDELLGLRPGFLAAIGELDTALQGAEGKIDTAAHRAASLSARQAVAAEREDPEAVLTATATAEALTAKVGAEVAVWEAAHRAGPRGPAWASSGPDGYARVRAALDRVGGEDVGLYESGTCAGGSAAACANSDGYIKYRADVATWSEDRLNWAMAHELAHIHQFRVWGALTESAQYRSLFGGDPEFLANCMAVVRGFPGAVGCDLDQQTWASAIWVGAVR